MISSTIKKYDNLLFQYAKELASQELVVFYGLYDICKYFNKDELKEIQEHFETEDKLKAHIKYVHRKARKGVRKDINEKARLAGERLREAELTDLLNRALIEEAKFIKRRSR
ncbi:MAG: hypothetical protein GY679_01835 [Mycoplasma sp.]|nr:hypothetical protein [Mycoplasma sp.]